MKEFLRGVIEEIKDEREKRVNSEPENFIEAFLDEITIRGNGGKSVDKDYNDENLVMVLNDLFLAGSETTGVALNWLLLYVSLYPEVQSKVYQEIRQVIGSRGNSPSLEHEVSMPYTKASIYEVLRMANLGPMPPPRVATEEFTVQGYTILKGAFVTFNLEPVFRDKEFWGDVETFRPERFLEKSVNVGGNGAEYEVVNTERIAVFGFGKRICAGENLAWNSIFLYFTTLLQTFEFSTIAGMEPSTEPIPSVTLMPQEYSLTVKTRED